LQALTGSLGVFYRPLIGSLGAFYRPLTGSLGVFYRPLIGSLGASLGASPGAFYRPLIASLGANSQQLPGDFKSPGLVLDSIRKAFLLGIICSILCAILFYLVPWLPLMSSPEAQQGGPTKVPDSPPELFLMTQRYPAYVLMAGRP
jgi:hypothetical protein